MHKTEKRLSLALLFAAGVIDFNVYMVVTGAAGNLYEQLPGTAPQHEAPGSYQALHDCGCASF
jgi:hypothetical protein